MRQKIGGVKGGARPLFLAGVIATLCVFIFNFVYLATSRTTFYQFSLGIPEEVLANPGENVTINGTILVTGWYWLHKFNLTLENLPYEYEIIPSYWEDVKILREWNPEVGVYKIPEEFQISINIPEDAYGVHIVSVNGQEHHSFREVSNSTFFVLKIRAEEKPPAAPELDVSDILVPERIEEGEPFNITFFVNNKGEEGTIAQISILLPEGWEVSEEKQLLLVKANDSAAGSFVVTPSETAGEVSLFIEYPYKQAILNLTRIGPYLKPTTPETTTTLAEKTPFESLIDKIKDAFAPYLLPIVGPFMPFMTPITIGVVVLLLVIIVWLLAGIVSHYRAKPKKKKPSKQVEEQIKKTVEQTEKIDFFDTGVDKL